MRDLREGLVKVENRHQFKSDIHTIRRALELRVEGDSYAAIAEQVGVADASTVRRWAKRYLEDDDFWKMVNSAGGGPLPNRVDA